MPKNDIGGFFVSLGLNTDKNSFETGNKLVDTVANSFNKLIGAARNAAVVLTGTAVASGQVESAAYKTAEKIGISTETLDLWKASAKIAGVDANGLISSMAKLSDVMTRMKIDGAGLEQFTKKLGELGLVTDDIDIAKMLSMAPDELMTEILRKAQEASAKVKKNVADANKALERNPKDSDAQKKLRDAQKEQHRISVIVGDILGEAGQDFFIELERQRKTIDDFLSGAGRTVFTTEEDNQKGADFAVEVNTLKTELESMGKLLGDSVGDELTPYLRKVNDWIQAHGDEIADNIKKIADKVGDIADKVINLGKWLITPEDKKQSQISMNNVLDGYRKGFKEMVSNVPYSRLSENDKNNIASYYLNIGSLDGLHLKYNDTELTDIKRRAFDVKKENQPGVYDSKGNKISVEKPTRADWWNEDIQDGIMRPDGTVTRVASDDWVFAARNVGDLAKAFVPQNIVPKDPAVNIVQQEQHYKKDIMPDTILNDLTAYIKSLSVTFIPKAPVQNTAPSEYTINQTFNISGSNDIPQVIREQAYRGTQDGLLQLMSQSSQRLQLMSGMR